MPNELMVGLVIAGVTGLTWLAYTHPKSFKRIYWPLFWFGGATMLAVSIWTMGLLVGFQQAIPHLPSDKVSVVDTAIKQLAPSPLTTLLIYLAFNAFTSFLLWMHEILDFSGKE